MWRTFGQETTITWLSRSIREGDAHHAYLLLGPEHVGKRTLATDIACALNCTSNEPPCGECEACRRILEGKHADVIAATLDEPADANEAGQGEEEEGARQGRSILLGQVRRLQHMANLPPFEGKTKVLLIEDADRMTPEASNSILKSLEEPPAQVVWLLLAADESRLLETIVSRCQRVDVQATPAPELEGYLVESYSVEPERASLIARLSRGRTGWAISAATDESVLASRTSRVETIIQLVYMTYAGRFDLARELENQYRRDPRGVAETLDLWTTWWRDLLVTKGGCRDSIVNVDYVNDLNEQAGRLSLEQIREFIGRLNEARENLDLNVIPRLVFDSLVYAIPRIEKSSGEGGTPFPVLKVDSETE
jgi:DNA polymerase-3 subunit delta'